LRDWSQNGQHIRQKQHSDDCVRNARPLQIHTPHLTAVAAIEVPYRGTLAPFQNRIIAAVSVQSNLPLFFGDYRAGKSNDDDAGDSMASEGSFDIVRIDGRDDG